MEQFKYYAPTKILFGKNTEAEVGELCKTQGASKVLVHFGGSSAKKSGLLDRVCGALQEAGLHYVTLGGVVPNPRLSKVYEGIEICRRGQRHRQCQSHWLWDYQSRRRLGLLQWQSAAGLRPYRCRPYYCRGRQ